MIAAPVLRRALCPLVAVSGLYACAAQPSASPRSAERALSEASSLALPKLDSRLAPGVAGLVTDDALVVAAAVAHPDGLVLEQWLEGAWRELARLEGPSPWLAPPVGAGVALRIRASRSGATDPVFRAWPMGVVLEDLPGVALLEGDAFKVDVAISSAPDARFGPATARLVLSCDAQQRALPAGCEAADCWSEGPAAWLSFEDLSTAGGQQHATLAAPGLGPASCALSAEMWLSTDSGALRVASDSRELVLLGGAWRWGDLHAHSRWSNDGCEDPDNDCAPDPDGPGADFFANAAAEGLDFAAITDHAEWDSYLPDGEGGEALLVWDGQAGVVADALDGPVLPILGYEWTYATDELDGEHRIGGHHTVLLSDPSACEAWRVASTWDHLSWSPEVGDWSFETDGQRAVAGLGALWAALDAAPATCNPEMRWISFAHHPAYSIPQPNDWLLEANRPDREQLVEIYSEHGSSECRDVAAEGCDFAVNDGQGQYPDGAVQTALDQGFQLGFVASTDAHDARPGSIGDGPGHVAWWTDADGDGVDETPATQFASGGLTGALVTGALDTNSLFDALEARRTVASSGPRPELRAYAKDRLGRVALPGQTLDADAGPFTLRLDVPAQESSGATLTHIERVGPGGEVRDAVEVPIYDTLWAPTEGEWTYLRLRYANPDGSEARVWLSPWFAE